DDDNDDQMKRETMHVGENSDGKEELFHSFNPANKAEEAMLAYLEYQLQIMYAPIQNSTIFHDIDKFPNYYAFIQKYKLDGLIIFFALYLRIYFYSHLSY
ncbi:hypothetical protein ACJX0J_033113, partial [Zea mays]